MTNPEHLERSYRRLLACYPKSFRREHEREILSVLMAAAEEDQRRPRSAESADLLKSAMLVRVRHMRVPSSWEHQHARVMVPVRILIGIWLVVLTAILYGYGRGGWWAALLLPAAALHFYFAYRLRHDVVES